MSQMKCVEKDKGNSLTIILVLGLIVFSNSSKSIDHSEAGEVLVAPSLGG